MRRFITSWAGLLWHKLEIGLMRVGEPIIGDEKNFLGVIIKKITFKAAKKIDYFLFNRVRYTLYNHAINHLAYPTL